MTDADMANQERPGNAGAVHDDWFRKQLAQGLREADDPATQWVSVDEVERRLWSK